MSSRKAFCVVCALIACCFITIGLHNIIYVKELPSRIYFQMTLFFLCAAYWFYKNND